MADDEICSPCPTPSPKNEDTHSLSERINISTRLTHIQLNRLIIARLPLALPPYTSNPSVYISGLLHIAPIYITFESIWQRILDAPCHQAKVCSRTHSILSRLQLPGLLRSGRLRGDIKTLSGISEQEVEAQLRTISQNSKISELIAHTTRLVNAKSHVLLAYAWVMYMALFSGGRYLRASLQNAGAEFWRRSPSPDSPCPHPLPQNDPRCISSQSSEGRDASEIPIPLESRNSRSESHALGVTQGLQLFHFLGEEDGEDIKKEFKKRFAEAEILLSPGEKDDIVQEAQHIFNFMVEMVDELDRICGSMDQNNTRVATTAQDSVCISKEGLSRRQDLRPEEQDARRPSILRAHRKVTPASSRMVRFSDTVSIIHLQALRQSVRKIITPLGSRFSRAGSLMASKNDRAMLDILKFRTDAAFVVSVLLFILVFGVWCFTLLEWA